MALASTALNVTSVATKVIDENTTWANTAINVSMAVDLFMFNGSAVPVYVGSQNMTTANLGIPITSAGSGALQQMSIVINPGDALFAITTASTATLNVLIGGQATI